MKLKQIVKINEKFKWKGLLGHPVSRFTNNIKNTISESEIGFVSGGMFLHFHSNLISTHDGKDSNLEAPTF
jgi:hypothetical protein